MFMVARNLTTHPLPSGITTDGLEFYLPLQNDANDSYGGNTTSVNGTMAFNGNYGSLDADNEYIQSGYTQTGQFHTFSIWIHAQALTTYTAIMGNFFASGGSGTYLLIANGVLEGGFGDGSSQVYVDSGALDFQTEFIHVVATMNGDTGEVKLYANGQLVGNITGSPHTIPNGEIFVGQFPFWISSDPNRNFKGDMVHARYYNRVLNAIEIQTIYNIEINTIISPSPEVDSTPLTSPYNTLSWSRQGDIIYNSDYIRFASTGNYRTVVEWGIRFNEFIRIVRNPANNDPYSVSIQMKRTELDENKNVLGIDYVYYPMNLFTDILGGNDVWARELKTEPLQGKNYHYEYVHTMCINCRIEDASGNFNSSYDELFDLGYWIIPSHYWTFY